MWTEWTGLWPKLKAPEEKQIKKAIRDIFKKQCSSTTTSISMEKVKLIDNAIEWLMSPSLSREVARREGVTFDEAFGDSINLMRYVMEVDSKLAKMPTKELHEMIKGLTKVNYRASEDLEEILMHLFLLRIFYKTYSFEDLPAGAFGCLDLSLMILLRAVCLRTYDDIHLGEKDDIITAQNIGKTSGRRKTVEFIKASLFEESNKWLCSRANERPYTRARKIHEKLEMTGKKNLPTEKTIVDNWSQVWEELKQERGIKNQS